MYSIYFGRNAKYPIIPNKKPFKQKMLEGLHPVFLTL